jgi:hypothetical protein
MTQLILIKELGLINWVRSKHENWKYKVNSEYDIQITVNIKEIIIHHTLFLIQL